MLTLHLPEAIPMLLRQGHLTFFKENAPEYDSVFVEWETKGEGLYYQGEQKENGLCHGKGVMIKAGHWVQIALFENDKIHGRFMLINKDDDFGCVVSEGKKQNGR